MMSEENPNCVPEFKCIRFLSTQIDSHRTLGTHKHRKSTGEWKEKFEHTFPNYFVCIYWDTYISFDNLYSFPYQLNMIIYNKCTLDVLNSEPLIDF